MAEHSSATSPFSKTRRQSLTATRAYMDRPFRSSSIISVGAQSNNVFGVTSLQQRFFARKRSSVDWSQQQPHGHLADGLGGAGPRNNNNNMWSNCGAGQSIGLLPGRRIIGPASLILLCPTLALLLCHAMTRRNGSLVSLWTEDVAGPGPGRFAVLLAELWLDFRSFKVWQMVIVYFAFQIIAMKFVPGETAYGPVTPAGNVPAYKLNGVQCFCAAISAFLLGAYFGLFNGGIIFDNLGQILAAMNIFALVFCLLLYIKGLVCPSSTDYGSSGNFVFDYYWGTELHPQILGCNVKQLIICRISMTFWALCILSCLFKQYEINSHVTCSMWLNVSLQLIYIAKFFVWESGYLRTVDICHDRAGFYLCWGSLVWLPSIYTSSTVYLVQKQMGDDGHLIIFSSPLILASFFLVGFTAIMINYDCDRQRQQFRATSGRQKIWGKDPLFIEAKYRIENGEIKTNLLLASGWWGLSRHFHYVPELIGSICWTCPAVGFDTFLPNFYVIFLAILLLDRVYRDDARCREKYGKYWDQYCYHVQYRVIPLLW